MRYLEWRGRHGSPSPRRQTLLAMRNRRQASERRRPSLILSAAPLPTFSATGPYNYHLDWGINQTSPCNVSLVEVRMRDREEEEEEISPDKNGGVDFVFRRPKRERERGEWLPPPPSLLRRRFEICIPFHSAGSFPWMTGNSPLALSLSLSLHGCATFHFCRHHLYCFAHMQRTQGRKEGTKGRSRSWSAPPLTTHATT